MVAERLPAMWGSATLATLVSSTSMKVASMTVRAMAQGLISGPDVGEARRAGVFPVPRQQVCRCVEVVHHVVRPSRRTL